MTKLDLWARLSPAKKWIAAASTALGVAAALAGILNYANWKPFASKPTKPVSVLDHTLKLSDKIKPPDEMKELAVSIEGQCKAAGANLSAMKCWLMLTDIYNASGQSRKALYAVNRAADIDVQVADPYYKKGHVYYGLLLLNLLEKRRYSIRSASDLNVAVFPDSESRIMAGLASEQYTRGEGKQFIGEDVQPENLVVTSHPIIGQTQQQLDAIESGARELKLYVREVQYAMVMLIQIFPEDALIKGQFGTIVPLLFDYMKQHRDEFPGMFIPE